MGGKLFGRSRGIYRTVHTCLCMNPKGSIAYEPFGALTRAVVTMSMICTSVKMILLIKSIPGQYSVGTTKLRKIWLFSSKIFPCVKERIFTFLKYIQLTSIVTHYFLTETPYYFGERNQEKKKILIVPELMKK